MVQLIDEIVACYKFKEYQACQYDPYHIISDKNKKSRRCGYEHKGSIEMEKIENQIKYSSEEENES